LAKIHRQGEVEPINVFNLDAADDSLRGYERIIAEDVVNSSTELQYRTGLQYIKLGYLADTLPRKKIAMIY
jgi:hypothetical protein